MSADLHRSFTCVSISHYSLIVCVVTFTTVFVFLLYDLLEGLAVLADNVDALLQSVCAVSHLSATDGEHLYVAVCVSFCRNDACFFLATLYISECEVVVGHEAEVDRLVGVYGLCEPVRLLIVLILIVEVRIVLVGDLWVSLSAMK